MHVHVLEEFMPSEVAVKHLASQEGCILSKLSSSMHLFLVVLTKLVHVAMCEEYNNNERYNFVGTLEWHSCLQN